MKFSALIFDLDNTLYPVPLYGDKMFASLFKLIEETEDHEADMRKIKRDMMRIPFQKVAKKYHFSKPLLKAGTELLSTLTYDEPLKPFDGYSEIKKIPAEKYLVTMGFNQFQSSKIEALGIENDFKRIYIVDPATSAQTKKEVFQTIAEENKYASSKLLVIGDDPDSEIKAGNELGMKTVLLDTDLQHQKTNADFVIYDLKELLQLVN